MSRTLKIAIAIAAPLVHGLAYGLANRFPSSAPIELPLTALDRSVPFVPETVWLYLSDYALVLAAFLACRDTRRFTAAFLGVIAASTFVQWLVPVAFPRGLYPVDPSAGVSAWAVATLWALDAPTSCFPSLHVAVSVVAALAVVRAPPARAPRLAPFVLGVWAAAVCAATLTVKQHYAIDVAGGVAVAAAVHLAVSLGAGPAPIAPLRAFRSFCGARMAQPGGTGLAGLPSNGSGDHQRVSSARPRPVLPRRA